MSRQLDEERVALQAFTVIAAVGLICVSVYFNLQAGMMRGSHAAETLAWIAASVFADVLKVASPVAAVLAFRRRELRVGLACIAMFCITAAYSLASALTFVHASTTDAVLQRSHAAEVIASTRATIVSLEQAIAASGPVLPKGVIEALLKARPIDPSVWRRTGQCRDVTLDNSRRECERYLDLRVELAKAEEIERKERQLFDERRRLEGLPAPAVADPTAAGVRAMLGVVGIAVSEEDIGPWLNLLAVMLVEAGSALGLVVAMALKCDGWATVVNGGGGLPGSIGRSPSPAPRGGAARTVPVGVPTTQEATASTVAARAVKPSGTIAASGREKRRDNRKVADRVLAALKERLMVEVGRRGGVLDTTDRELAGLVGGSPASCHRARRALSEEGRLNSVSDSRGTRLELVEVG